MAPSVSVSIRGVTVGQIVFEENPHHLTAIRLPGGFRLQIPITVELGLADSGDPQPMVSNLRARIEVPGREGRLVEVGTARDDRWYTGAIPKSNAPGVLDWQGPFAELCTVELLRNGNQATFNLNLWGESCYLFLDQSGRRRIRSEPSLLSGQVQISYRKEVWVEMLRSLQIAETVLVEIPLPQSPPAPWDEVWRALVEARNAFESGGSTGWKGCVAATRLALEKWQGIEKEEMGPGWAPPQQRERESRTKKQRLDNLRWHLLQCAHLAPHSPADDWARDDALLCLATLSALLAQRNP